MEPFAHMEPAVITDAASPSDKEINLRVLEVIPGNGEGAAFVFARRQVTSLSGAGVNTRAFYLNRASPRVLAREWGRLRQEIRRFRPVIVHAHFGGVTAFACATATAVPLVVTFQGSDLNHNPDARPIREWVSHLLSQVACLRAKRIITVSEQLHRRLWWRRGQATVIPTGIDLRLFRPFPKDEARRMLGWPAEGRIVVFHRGGRPRLKGAELVEAAVHAAQTKVGPIHLMSFDGDIPGELVPYWINAADCVALGSVSEGSPNIVKEALACNVPVVATDVGDVRERLRGVYPSRVVSRDGEEFAAALSGVLQQPRAGNGREHVAGLSEPRIADAVRAVYLDVIQQRLS